MTLYAPALWFGLLAVIALAAVTSVIASRTNNPLLDRCAGWALLALVAAFGVSVLLMLASSGRTQKVLKCEGTPVQVERCLRRAERKRR